MLLQNADCILKHKKYWYYIFCSRQDVFLDLFTGDRINTETYEWNVHALIHGVEGAGHQALLRDKSFDPKSGTIYRDLWLNKRFVSNVFDMNKTRQAFLSMMAALAWPTPIHLTGLPK